MQENDNGPGIHDHVLTYADRIQQEFLRLYDMYNVVDASDKRRADIIDSFWHDIYMSVFAPDDADVLYNNQRSKLKSYKVYDIESVIEMYIALCKRYGGVVKIGQFCNLTGYNLESLHRWHRLNNSDKFIFTMSKDEAYSESNVNIYSPHNITISNMYDNFKETISIKYNNSINRDTNDSNNNINNNTVYTNDSSSVNNTNSDSSNIMNNTNSMYDIYNYNTIYIGNNQYIDKDDIDKLTYMRYDIYKRLRIEMQDSNTNGLSNDTMGNMFRANNEEELGKLYEPKRAVINKGLQQSTVTAQQIAAKYGLSLPDANGDS